MILPLPLGGISFWPAFPSSSGHHTASIAGHYAAAVTISKPTRKRNNE